MILTDLIGTLPVHPTKTYPQRATSALTRVVLHHAAGPEDQTVEEIARYHVHVRGWPGIAYAYCISAAGEIFKCWPATTISWCVANGNTASLCVCLIGNRDIVAPPPAQWNAAVELAANLMLAYAIRTLCGHREVPTVPPQATACPGQLMDMTRFGVDVAAMVDAMLKGGVSV